MKQLSNRQLNRLKHGFPPAILGAFNKKNGRRPWVDFAKKMDALLDQLPSVGPQQLYDAMEDAALRVHAEAWRETKGARK